MAVPEAKTVYVTYIAAGADRVWSALTDGAFTSQYLFGLRVDSDWRVGSAVNYYLPDGTLHVSGEVLACEPPRRRVVHLECRLAGRYQDLPRTSITFEVVDLGQVVRLTMTEGTRACSTSGCLRAGAAAGR